MPTVRLTHRANKNTNQRPTIIFKSQNSSICHFDILDKGLGFVIDKTTDCRDWRCPVRTLIEQRVAFPKALAHEKTPPCEHSGVLSF
jgi:hypothetical protein